MTTALLSCFEVETHSVTLELHPKQSEVYLSPATEILFGGAAGPGKSHLLRVAAIAWCYDIPGLQVHLFRRTFPDLWKNHMDGPSAFPALLSPAIRSGRSRINYGDKRIHFRNGSTIHLCHCQYEKDVYNYQGAEMHVLMIDELTHFTAGMYRYLRGRVRLGGLELPEKYLAGNIGPHGQVNEWNLFPRVVVASNPGGIGHNFVKSTFIDYAPPYEIKKAAPEDGGMYRQFIPALMTDNPTLMRNDPAYRERLQGLGNPALVRAMELGDWDIVAGGMFDDVWRRERHVVKPFPIPPSWYVDRSFDWGSSHPFSVGWWAESDGSAVETGPGRSRKFPRGTLFRIAEWYGWTGEPNTGLRMTDTQIGQGIREWETKLLERYPGVRIQPGPADSSIFDVEPGRDSIASGINAGYWGGQTGKDRDIFTRADKTPGSRVRGWQALRRRLQASLPERPEEPGFFVFDSCTQFIRTVPVLPRDEKNVEDVDTGAEDHIADETRYRVLAARAVASRVKLGFGG